MYVVRKADGTVPPAAEGGHRFVGQFTPVFGGRDDLHAVGEYTAMAEQLTRHT
jgi:hypothetical protein